jgi:class 3 adenylate cyclase/TPR repeat protein
LLEGSEEDTSKVQILNEISSHVVGSEPRKAIELSLRAKDLSESISYTSGFAISLKRIGIGHYFLGEYVEAMQYWQEAEQAYKKAGDKAGVSNMLNNMGAIYLIQADYTKAIEVYLKSLQLGEEVKDTLRVATALQNIGAVHDNKGDYELALEVYLKALPLFVSLNDNDGTGLTSINIGDIYAEQGDYDNALNYYLKAIEYLTSSSYYHAALRSIGEVKIELHDFKEGIQYIDSAYTIALKAGDAIEVTLGLNAIADAHYRQGNRQEAILFFEKAKSKALEISSFNQPLKTATEGLVELYSSQNNYNKAFENQLILQNVSDSIYNADSDRKANRMLFNFEIEKKQVEIALLVKDQQVQKLEVEKQRGIKNGFVVGFLMVLLFAGTVLIQRNRIKKGKKESDELLLNILPEKIARELKSKGSSDAQFFDEVTVIFTDFKGFTAMSEQLSPKDLVRDLHECFSEFDRICEMLGIEKIKTIGDAYMAASGVPSQKNTNAQDIVNAALKMRDFVETGKNKKIESGLPYFEIRIGVHTGPVVAGIVGVKKFQYDIWGDTVNIASRMESSGEVGKVNISQSSFDLLKDNPEFSFQSRGKIKAKGKGEMEMYFVERK